MDGMTMDHGGMTMDMTPTATASSAAATTTAAMNMDMGSSTCKINMLWNWYTIDACFISESWHITSAGMFAGSCIGVLLLTMSLEFLRRSVKEYDGYLLRAHRRAYGTKLTGTVPPFRPNIFQQAIRALLHTLQFIVAYFVMLLAMYYNGYLLISIFIGAYLGSFLFHWEAYGGSSSSKTSASEEATVCCG